MTGELVCPGDGTDIDIICKNFVGPYMAQNVYITPVTYSVKNSGIQSGFSPLINP